MERAFRKIPSFAVRILPYIFIFVASLYLPRDPDLGWHLKYGEHLLQHHQLLRENAFSTMMPNYQWTNASWATDGITYAIYRSTGFLGLTIVSALIVTLTFFFFSKAARLTFIEEAIFFPILAYLLSPINSSSFRGQQISLLFLGILFFILSKYKPFSKTLFAIPLLFLLWVNLHAESFLGLALFTLWIGCVLIKKFFTQSLSSRPVIPPLSGGIQNRKLIKESLFLLSILIVSLITTFINPFGPKIHLFALSHFDDPLLKKVTEYLPFLPFSKLWWNHITATILILLGITYLFFKKKLLQTLPVWGVPLILLLFSFEVRRYAWPLYYLSFPFFHLLGKSIDPYLKKNAIFIGAIILLISISYALSLKIPVSQFTGMSWEKYCKFQEVPCSPGSAEYLRRHNLTRNLYSYYDWGGWLIWNYPDVKPNIDGRMHLWRDNYAYSASAEYAAYENVQKSIDDSSYDVVYIPMNRSPLYFELSKLVSQKKWKLVYDDEIAGIIIRIKKNK